jgi:hypothetical protein
MMQESPVMAAVAFMAHRGHLNMPFLAFRKEYFQQSFSR